MARALLLALPVALVLVACGDDGSPGGTDAGIADAGTTGVPDAGGTANDSGSPLSDAGPVARSDAGAERMCPPARDTRCGTACTGSATMCLCTCGGGGPDFTACDCVGGAWDCQACP